MFIWSGFGFGAFVCVATSIAVALMLVLWRDPPRGGCRRCGHVNLAQARYCGHCGQRLSDDPVD